MAFLARVARLCTSAHLSVYVCDIIMLSLINHIPHCRKRCAPFHASDIGETRPTLAIAPYLSGPALHSTSCMGKVGVVTLSLKRKSTGNTTGSHYRLVSVSFRRGGCDCWAIVFDMNVTRWLATESAPFLHLPSVQSTAWVVKQIKRSESASAVDEEAWK